MYIYITFEIPIPIGLTRPFSSSCQASAWATAPVYQTFYAT